MKIAENHPNYVELQGHVKFRSIFLLCKTSEMGLKLLRSSSTERLSCVMRSFFILSVIFDNVGDFWRVLW